MKTIVCKNGVKIIIDETLKTGDLITAYHKGYHEIVTIEERNDCAPLVYFKTRFKSDGEPTNSKKIMMCDMGYCRHAEIGLANEIRRKEKEIEKLKAILSTLE